MKKLIPISVLLAFCLIFAAHGIAQQTELELQHAGTTVVKEKADSEKNASAPVIISAELIKQSNDTLTFKITHPDLKQSLYYSQEKRDALFALPGIIEIALYGDEPTFTVKMLRFYAEKYLNTQFDICREDHKELFEEMRK
jgi:hypothetical protein